MSFYRLARELAASLLAGVWQKNAMVRRTRQLFGTGGRWVPLLIDRVLNIAPSPPPPAFNELADFLLNDDGFFRACRTHRLRIVKRHLTHAPMQPKAGAPSGWDVQKLATEGDLCKWLDLTPEQLQWFADVHGRERMQRRGPLRQYVYKWVKKRSGALRLLEIPKAKLKLIQRRILSEILDKIPVHPSAHGFVKNGSVRGFVTPHCNQQMLLRMDLKDFFISVQASRVHATFRTAGYPEEVARLLTGLCTNSVPTAPMRMVPWNHRLTGPQEMLLRTPHLPQGAPTSPALANLCAHRMDSRLCALAAHFEWYYTRYADDMLFSGPRVNRNFLNQLKIWIESITILEDFKLNTRKTRVMRKGARQHAAGLVLNEKPNISRDHFDSVKAILHNCAKHGPSTQNRDHHPNFRAHLLGRITHVTLINPLRGARLRRIFDKIVWPV